MSSPSCRCGAGRSPSTSALSPGLTRVRVTAVDGRNRRATATVDQVYALPPGSKPRERAPRLDPTFQRTVRALVRQHGGTAGVYVQDLRSGRGAAWNALARFPAASTLKLAIAVTVLRRLDGKPANGTRLAVLLGRMLAVSDNEAANELEVWLAGSTAAGSHVVDETMRALGMTDSLMFGGYETTAPAGVAGAPIPIRVESQPSFPFGKYTTASDLARLARAVYLAAAGKGPLLRLGVTGSEARYLLFCSPRRATAASSTASSATIRSCCTRRAGCRRRATTAASSRSMAASSSPASSPGGWRRATSSRAGSRSIALDRYARRLAAGAAAKRTPSGVFARSGSARADPEPAH